ncbi:flagellar protein FlhE [Pectobacterium punjabense]|uniref:flagellar protein FlhE n=1 Tax=Pectobacterium punjabense TaxID=2108399 RepID=UPI003D9BCB4C
MKTFKTASVIALLSLSSFFLSNSAHAISGAYTSAPMASMDVHSANFWNQFNFPISSSFLPPSNAKVTRVYWNYALGQLQVGSKGTLIVYLCQGNTSTCFDISNMNSGSTEVFRDQSATTPFFLYYRVNSRSTIGSIYGSGSTQVTVNWQNNQ